MLMLALLQTACSVSAPDQPSNAKKDTEQQEVVLPEGFEKNLAESNPDSVESGTPDESKSNGTEGASSLQQTNRAITTHVQSSSQQQAARAILNVLNESDAQEEVTLPMRLSAEDWENIYRIDYAVCDALGWQYMDLSSGYKENDGTYRIVVHPAQARNNAKSASFSSAELNSFLAKLNLPEDLKQIKTKDDLTKIVQAMHDAFAKMDKTVSVSYPAAMLTNSEISSLGMAQAEMDVLQHYGLKPVLLSGTLKNAGSHTNYIVAVAISEPKTDSESNKENAQTNSEIILYDDPMRVYAGDTAGTLSENMPEDFEPAFGMDPESVKTMLIGPVQTTPEVESETEANRT